jgi:hypothetical protein
MLKSCMADSVRVFATWDYLQLHSFAPYVSIACLIKCRYTWTFLAYFPSSLFLHVLWSNDTYSDCSRVHRCKVKMSHPCRSRSSRPMGLRELRFAHFLENRFTDGCELVSLTLRTTTLCPPTRFLVLISVTGRLGQLKYTITSDEN